MRNSIWKCYDRFVELGTVQFRVTVAAGMRNSRHAVKRRPLIEKSRWESRNTRVGSWSRDSEWHAIDSVTGSHARDEKSPDIMGLYYQSKSRSFIRKYNSSGKLISISDLEKTLTRVDTSITTRNNLSIKKFALLLD